MKSPQAQASLTNLLIAAVAVLSVTAVVGWSRLNANETAALNAQRDLARVRADLDDLGAWNVTAAGPSNDGGNASNVNRRIRSAAAAAGLVDQLVSVEPGPTLRVRDTDALRTPIFLRLEGVTLARLVPFLNDLASGSAVRVTGIDLTAPVGPVAQSSVDEIWSADLTLSESSVVTGDGGTP